MSAADVEGPVFIDALAVEQSRWRRGRAVWSTLTPMRYRHDAGTVVIPEVFITDLASVPRLPVAWLFAGGKGNRAAVLHDFAYQFTALLYEQDSGELAPRPVNRQEADRLFREALKADPWGGTNMITRFMMWSAVRVFGRFAHKGKKAADLNPKWTSMGLPMEAQPEESSSRSSSSGASPPIIGS